jgi:putative intracellular protease/amidase
MTRFLRFAIPLALALAVVLGLGNALHTPDARAEAKHYVCVACGLPCDHKLFDKPGTCPDCGMALVEQGSAAATPAVDSRRKVAILLFNGVEIIDSMGPYELFGAANYNVYTVAETREPVTSAMGLTLVPKYTFADAPQPDVLVVPGGGVRGAQSNAALLKYVTDVTAATQHTMSVCNGSFILASAGLLDGLTATSTYGNVLRLHAQFPKVKVVGDQRFVDNGKIITTAGLSAGMDGALHVIAKLEGEARAREVALNEEYNWQPNDGYVRPAMADRFIPNIDVEKESGATTGWKVLSSTGDASHWDVAVQGASSQSASELLGKFGQALEREAHWTAAPAATNGGKAGANSRAWSFPDLDGRTWHGSLTVEPVKGTAGEYTARLAVSRS